ncbi:MAG: hypothetical protein EBR92_08990, partial [Alphaproteobacteria bacterium]|nr:hypothetical protein [Alphaproteobacteria bacterium]
MIWQAQRLFDGRLLCPNTPLNKGQPMPFWRFLKQQYDYILRAAGTMLAERLLYVFAALESVIFPIPVDPL